ncbi:MAG: nitrilase-related carbon-nitrogen hydrolase [Candidatus Bathyarchaeia archaeon]
MKVGFVQFSPIFGKPQKNLERIKSLLEGKRADLIVLPELSDTGYLFSSRDEAFNLASTLPGPVSDELQEIAKEIGGCVVAGVCERAGKRVYNSACLVAPNGLVGVYRKSHLFGLEKKWFDPGNTGFNVYRINGVKVGLMICFDWIFPEAARVLALKGAQIICQPANLILPFCQKAMLTRALENRVFIITANRIGKESRKGYNTLRFTGSSQIVSPDSTILIKAPKARNCVGIIEINPDDALNKTFYPPNDLFSDRRPELYKKICERKLNP